MYPFWFRHWLGTKCVPSHYQTWWRSLRYKGVTWNFWFYMFWLIEIWIYMAISMTEWKAGISSVLTMEMQHFGTKSSICGRQYFRHRIFNVFICFQVFWQWQNTWNLVETWPSSINYIPRIRRIGGCYGFTSMPPVARNGVNAITQKPRDGLFSNLVYTLVVIVSWPD